jgi:hypothetical protein
MFKLCCEVHIYVNFTSALEVVSFSYLLHLSVLNTRGRLS